MFHATFITILECFTHTLQRYFTFSGTNQLTRCRSASCCFSAVFGFRNPSKEIFSELDEINAQGPIFPRSFQKTEGESKWGHEVARQQGGAAQALAAPACRLGPPCRLLTYPFAYLKPPSRNPQYREPRYGKPSRDAAAANPISGDSGDRLRHPAGEGNHLPEDSSSP